MVEYVSIIPTNGEEPYDEYLDRNPGAMTHPPYLDKIRENGRTFQIELYVCDKDVVYNNMNNFSDYPYGVTESWLINNPSKYIHKFDESTLVSIELSEEMCTGGTYDVGAVVSQQMTVTLYKNDDYINNCTTPTFGYSTYFEDKCLIGFSRLALVEDENGEVITWGSIPLGVYYVSQISGDYILNLTCYDKMLDLERKMVYQNLDYNEVIEKMVRQYKIPTSHEFNNHSVNHFYDKEGNIITVPPGNTYRELLKYIPFCYLPTDKNFLGYVGFNRYGLLDYIAFHNTLASRRYGIQSLTSEDILQNNFSNSVEERDCKTVKIEFGDNNKISINNGYAILSQKLEYAKEDDVLKLVEKFSAGIEDEGKNPLTPGTMSLHGFPHYTVADELMITLQESSFNTQTGENTYIDKTPFYFKIHKQDLTLGSSVSQTVQCFDVETSNLLIASSNNSLDIPTNSGLFNIVFGANKYEFLAQDIISKKVDFDKKAHNTIGKNKRQYLLFATPKAKRPSKIFPPSIDLGNFQDIGQINVAAYCNTAANAIISWFAFKLLNYSNADDDLTPNAYVTKGNVIVDTYEEYHEGGAGYLILDDFIMQWGLITVKNAVSGGNNEYYADLYYVAELEDEPAVLLMPSSAVPNEIQSCSYLNIDDNVPLSKGLRVYTYDTDIPQAGRQIQFLILGRTKGSA